MPRCGAPRLRHGAGAAHRPPSFARARAGAEPDRGRAPRHRAADTHHGGLSCAAGAEALRLLPAGAVCKGRPASDAARVCVAGRLACAGCARTRVCPPSRTPRRRGGADARFGRSRRRGQRGAGGLPDGGRQRDRIHARTAGGAARAAQCAFSFRGRLDAALFCYARAEPQPPHPRDGRKNAGCTDGLRLRRDVERDA